MTRNRVLTVVGRELTTLVRTRTFLTLSVGFAVVVMGLAWIGGTQGYLSVVLTLLTPMEALVPALALAFGYRAIRADKTRGELAVVRTFPLTRGSFLLGVFLGRASALVVTLLVPLVLVAPAVALFGGAKTQVIASYSGADTFVLYVRFVLLVVIFGLVALAIALAISTLASSEKSALAAAVAVALALVVGVDLAILAGVGTGMVDDGLAYVLAVSPNSAFRGLVLESVVGPAALRGPTANPIASVVGLLFWFVGAFGIAVVSVWRGST